EPRGVVEGVLLQKARQLLRRFVYLPQVGEQARGQTALRRRCPGRTGEHQELLQRFLRPVVAPRKADGVHAQQGRARRAFLCLFQGAGGLCRVAKPFQRLDLQRQRAGGGGVILQGRLQKRQRAFGVLQGELVLGQRGEGFSR